MEIVKVRPALKEILWGGQRLKQVYSGEATAAEMDNIAEAWVLSCHRDGQSVVVGGLDDGLMLGDVIAREIGAGAGTQVLGARWDGGDFPLLIKLIDAKERLSVQVHPDDAYARARENDNGKTEAWYILECDTGAQLVYGFNEEMSREALRTAIAEGRLEDYVNAVEVHPGDVAFIPAGTLHAIGGGILLAEVQQSSNTTYRVFDYNRKDKNGNTRELHVEKALDVLDTRALQADFSPAGAREEHEGYARTLLTQCAYFSMTLVECKQAYASCADECSFVSLLVLGGEGVLESAGVQLPLRAGDSVFIPAGKGEYYARGELRMLETRL